MNLADEVAEVGVKVHEFEKARDDRGTAKCASASCIVYRGCGLTADCMFTFHSTYCRSTSTMDNNVGLLLWRK